MALLEEWLNIGIVGMRIPGSTHKMSRSGRFSGMVQFRQNLNLGILEVFSKPDDSMASVIASFSFLDFPVGWDGLHHSQCHSSTFRGLSVRLLSSSREQNIPLPLGVGWE